MMALKLEALAEAPIELDEEQVEKVTLSGRREERKSRRQKQTDRNESVLHLRTILRYIFPYLFPSLSPED